MARTFFRDVGGGRRAGSVGFMTSAVCLLLLSFLVVGCDLQTPTSPNDPSDLTGQTTNQVFSFSGTITVTSSSSTVTGDDASTVTITAVVKDAAGNPIANLTTVTFSTNVGGFNTGGTTAFTQATATTFNGTAQVLFQSVNRSTGTATITANIGTTTGTTNVTIDAAPVSGTISLAPSVTSGALASEASPLNTTFTATAADLSGAALAGATVKFVVVSDTTDEGSSNPPATWVASSTTFTNSAGAALNVLRVTGSGDVIVEARLIDPNTSQVVATSNRAILTTQGALLVDLVFTPEGTSSFTGAAPYTKTINARVTDASGAPQAGMTVTFSIDSDTSLLGASLSTSQGVTDGGGNLSSSVTVPDNNTGTGTSVTIKAVVTNSAGTVLATSTTIVAIGT